MKKKGSWTLFDHNENMVSQIIFLSLVCAAIAEHAALQKDHDVLGLTRGATAHDVVQQLPENGRDDNGAHAKIQEAFQAQEVPRVDRARNRREQGRRTPNTTVPVDRQLADRRRSLLQTLSADVDWGTDETRKNLVLLANFPNGYDRSEHALDRPINHIKSHTFKLEAGRGEMIFITHKKNSNAPSDRNNEHQIYVRVTCCNTTEEIKLGLWMSVSITGGRGGDQQDPSSVTFPKTRGLEHQTWWPNLAVGNINEEGTITYTIEYANSASGSSVGLAFLLVVAGLLDLLPA